MPGPAPVLIMYAARSRRVRRLVLVGLSLVLVVVLALAAALAAVVGSSRGGGGRACLATITASEPAGAPVGQWDAEQRSNAQIIVETGHRLGVPPRGQLVALATAMQESTLRNRPGGHLDSVGLFQQRPSAGWGTPAQIRDPVYAATKFYERLVAVPGWEALPVTEAAQAVQRSAFPGAYARWEQAAAELLTSLGTALGNLVCNLGNLAAGAAAAAIDWARGQLGKPYKWGASGPHAFDCSGLTLRAWQAAGVQLPRVSRDQARAGAHIPLQQAQPGDLIFKTHDGTDRGVHHVALYLGNGQLLEAPYTGAEVRVRPISWDERGLLPYAVRPGAPSAT
jgi:hypothetical protein